MDTIADFSHAEMNQDLIEPLTRIDENPTDYLVEGMKELFEGTDEVTKNSKVLNKIANSSDIEESDKSPQVQYEICMICHDNLPETEFSKLSNCACRVCETCLKDWFTVKVVPRHLGTKQTRNDNLGTKQTRNKTN